MKKISTSTIFLMLALFSNAQTIPNGGFEDWTNNIIYEDPNEWTTLNFFSAFGLPITVSPGTPAPQGTKYAHMETAPAYDPDGNLADTVAAIMFSGNLNLATQTGALGFPVNSMANYLNGKYRYSANGGNDVGAGGLFFTKWNTTTNMQDTLGIGEVFFDADQTGWANFSVQVVPVAAGVPDSCTIVFASSITETPEPGAYLDLDDLQFSQVSSVSEVKESRKFIIYPNPAEDVVNLDLTAFGENTRLQVTCMNMSGAIISNQSMMSTIQSMDISTLPTGAYFIRVHDGKRAYTNSFIKR